MCSELPSKKFVILFMRVTIQVFNSKKIIRISQKSINFLKSKVKTCLHTKNFPTLVN